MSLTGTRYIDNDDQILLKRWAEYVRPYSEKSLARTIGCTERTAKHYRNGTAWPTARHWRLIVRAFGRDVLAAVFEPEINETLARLRREERELREQLHELEARRFKALGGLAGDEERGFAAVDRAPLDADLFDGEAGR